MCTSIHFSLVSESLDSGESLAGFGTLPVWCKITSVLHICWADSSPDTLTLYSVSKRASLKIKVGWGESMDRDKTQKSKKKKLEERTTYLRLNCIFLLLLLIIYEWEDGAGFISDVTERRCWTVKDNSRIYCNLSLAVCFRSLWGFGLAVCAVGLLNEVSNILYPAFFRHYFNHCTWLEFIWDIKTVK